MNRNSLSTYDSAMLSDDGDLYSDDEDGNSYGSGDLRNSLGEKIIPSAADRRAHHNALERKRRDHIKDSFSSLRDSVPSLQGEKVTASRAQILKKAAEYIQFMRKKNTNVQQDIDDIAKQNKMLEDQIRKMEKIRPGSSGMTKQQLSSLFSSNEPTDVSTSYDISENSNGSSNSGLGSRPMVVSAVAGTSATTNSIAAVSIMNSIDNSNNKNNNGTVLNGSVAGTVAVRPVTMKNGTSKIIVQNPQHKNTPHVIHVTTTPGGTATGNGLASNISMSGTGTPIIISTSQLSSPSSSVSMGSTNGTNNGYVINKGAGAISLASVQNGFRTLVVQSGVGSGTPSAVTATPNIHILGTIPANSYSKPPTKKIKISSDSDSIISPVGGGNNGTNNVTSVSS